MLIGELSNKTGLSRDTIRFYEKQRLITISRKERRDNNYKEYSEKTLEKLLTIKRIKSFGFTLHEISELLNLMEIGNASCENVSDKMVAKTKQIDNTIKNLLELKAQMLNGISNCANNCCESEKHNCQILHVL
ncbi:DNA-binding transcriptional MerR regulator [Arcicella rosea]|uniref:MerR family transcriptional regulator n=1 Tax=Arcicella rosea TaxID=502909 RepID=UPI00345D3B46